MVAGAHQAAPELTRRQRRIAVSEEPEFISQTDEPMTLEEQQIWFRAKADEANARGATFHRFSRWDKVPPAILLHEGWRVRPQDQGEPRFQGALGLVWGHKTVEIT